MSDWGAWIFAIAVLGVMALGALGLFYVCACELIRIWPTISVLKRIHNIAVLLFLLGAVNFALGMGIIEIGIMGGTAMNGNVEQGNYYLGEHGTYTKVSQKTFTICLYYEKALLTMMFLSPVVSVVTYVAQRPPRHTIFKMLQKGKD